MSSHKTVFTHSFVDEVMPQSPNSELNVTSGT